MDRAQFRCSKIAGVTCSGQIQAFRYFSVVVISKTTIMHQIWHCRGNKIQFFSLLSPQFYPRGNMFWPNSGHPIYLCCSYIEKHPFVTRFGMLGVTIFGPFSSCYPNVTPRGNNIWPFSHWFDCRGNIVTPVLPQCYSSWYIYNRDISNAFWSW